MKAPKNAAPKASAAAALNKYAPLFKKGILYDMGNREMTIKELLDADQHLKGTRAEKKQLVANHKQALEDYRQASKQATERVNAAALARTKIARRAQAEGFSKQEIADVLGVAYSTVSRILAGER